MDPAVYNKSNKLEKDKYHRISFICEILKNKKQNKTKPHRYREQICGFHRGRGWRVGDMGEGGQIYDDEW